MKSFAFLFVTLVASVPARADVKPVAPLPGRDTVVAGKPDWCGDYEPSGLVKLDFARMEIEAHGYTNKALRELAQVACEKPLDPETQRAVAAWRQEWINLTGLPLAQEHAALALRLDEQRWERDEHKFCADVKPGAEAGPAEKQLAAALAIAGGCSGDTALAIAADGTASDLGWWLDRRAEVSSELARAMFVLRCVRRLGNDADWPDVGDPWTLGAYASCGPDGRRLDAAALEKELAAAPWNDVSRTYARATFALAKATIAHVAADVAALVKKEPAYQKPLIDAPEAGWKAWEADYAAHRAAFDAALAYEDKLYGPSTKALLGCGDELRKHFVGYVGSKHPKDPKAARRVATDQVGGVLLASLALCDAVEGRFLAARVEAEALRPNEVPIRRGPRLAAYAAALDALNDLVADRARFPWQPKQLRTVIDVPRDVSLYDAIADRIANKTVYDNPVRGVVGGVKGDAIAFKKVKTTIPNRICTPNGRILSVRDGNVIYDSDCVTKGTVTLDETPADVHVAPEAMPGLKPGVRATFEIDQSDFKVRRAFPVEIWQGDALVAYLGVAM